MIASASVSLMRFMWLVVLLLLTNLHAAREATTAEAVPKNDDNKGHLTYRLYDNAALAGNATVTGYTDTVTLSLSATSDSDDCLLSGEIEGSITFSKQQAWYTFDCHFHGTSTGWVWVDGHVVCGDGNPYNFDIWDNPLKIPIFPDRQDVKTTLPFRAHITTNKTKHCHQQHDGDATAPPSLDVLWKREPVAIFSGSGRLDPPPFEIMKHQEPNELLDRTDSTVNANAIFHPKLPTSEQKREELQRSLKQGWGYWLRSNILSIVKLPEGLVVTFNICSMHNSSDCLETAVPDTQGVIRVDLHAYDRSYISYNVSYAGMQIQMECSVTGEKQQQLEYLVTVHESEIDNDLLMRVGFRYAWFRPGSFASIPNGYAFQTPGLGNVNFTFLMPPADFEDVSRSKRNLRNDIGASTAAQPSSTSSNSLHIPLTGPAQQLGFVAGFDKDAPQTVQEITSNMNERRLKEGERTRTKFGIKAPVAEAIQAAVMWTMIYNPIENGPFMPVSRSPSWDFGGTVGRATVDWAYVMFDWDNLFASLLAALDNKDIAYSNLFQVIKSKTAAGFIPNWSTGGLKSQDRTEPPVGARVLLDLYNKFNDEWIVEALWDDLMDWNDWFMEKRLLKDVGLIALGSHWEPHNSNVSPPGDTMQAARFESGLDNSPMYDGDLYDKSVHLMSMSDVGMSALVCQEAYSLAELADVIGKDPSISSRLRKRADELLRAILTHSWDPSRQIFANRYHLRSNHTSVPHITPTSFYPFMLSDSQIWKEWVHEPQPQVIEGVAKTWLLNSSRFCISPNGDFEGNDPNSCYWGLPSVSADDPTFMKGNFHYWRGLSWGPMAQIVHWSLQSKTKNEDSIAVTARKALCKQMEAMMMSQWNANRHICENYSPYKNASDCSGTRYYHWGALNGLIGMVEDGYW